MRGTFLRCWRTMQSRLSASPMRPARELSFRYETGRSVWSVSTVRRTAANTCGVGGDPDMQRASLRDAIDPKTTLNGEPHNRGYRSPSPSVVSPYNGYLI